MVEWFRPNRYGQDRTAGEALEALMPFGMKVAWGQKESVIQFIQDWNSLPPKVQVENLQGLGGLKHITNEEAKQIILNNSPGNIPPTKLIAIYGKELIFINFNYINDRNILHYYILHRRRTDTGESIEGINYHDYGMDLSSISDTGVNKLWHFYEWNVKSTLFMNWAETPF